MTIFKSKDTEEYIGDDVEREVMCQYDNDGNIDVDGDHVEGNNEDDQCALTCWMELVTVSRESKEFATRSIFPENIYY